MAQKLYGYPKRVGSGYALQDFQGKTIGHGERVNSSRIRPGARGSWISNERVSYRFKVDGKWYSCRGYGEGMSASCREMKPASVRRAHLSGARRRRR